MKILYIINAFTGGGAEKLLRDMLFDQIARDIDVSVMLLGSANNHYLQEVQSKFVNVYISNCSSLYSPKQIKEIKWVINQEDFNIVHVHLFPALYWGAIVNILTRKDIKFVYTEHSTHNRRRDKFYLRGIEFIAYSQYKKIFCISEGTEKALNKWIPLTKKKTVVIPNGVNLDEYHNAKSYSKSDLFQNAKKDDKIIVMTARFSEQKDHDTLVRSMKFLDESYKLLLVGDGERINHVKSLTHQEGLDDRVTFLGFRKDIPEILNTVDIFVLSSNWEGFGLVAVEAMASKVPVLVSDVPGLKEVVGRKDMTFPAGDSKTLADQLKSILLDDIKKREFIAYGIERSQGYSIDVMVNSTEERYRQLLMN